MAAGDDPKAQGVVNSADDFYENKKTQIKALNGLTLLDGLVPQMWQYKDDTLAYIEELHKPVPPVAPAPKQETKPKDIKNVYRQSVFASKTLTTEEEIDAYVEKARKYLKDLLKGHDGIKLS